MRTISNRLQRIDDWYQQNTSPRPAGTKAARLYALTPTLSTHFLFFPKHIFFNLQQKKCIFFNFLFLFFLGGRAYACGIRLAVRGYLRYAAQKTCHDTFFRATTWGRPIAYALMAHTARCARLSAIRRALHYSETAGLRSRWIFSYRSRLFSGFR